LNCLTERRRVLAPSAPGQRHDRNEILFCDVSLDLVLPVLDAAVIFPCGRSYRPADGRARCSSAYRPARDGTFDILARGIDRGLDCLPRTLPATTKVMLPPFLASLSVACYTHDKTLGLERKMKIFSSSASLESIDPTAAPGSRGRHLFLRQLPADVSKNKHSTRSSTALWVSTTCTRRQARGGQEPRLAGVGRNLRRRLV